MSLNTVNISFDTDFLKEIDIIAKKESRTRSELIREAIRLYIEKKEKWDLIFNYAASHARNKKLTEDDIQSEITKFRKVKRKNNCLK